MPNITKDQAEAILKKLVSAPANPDRDRFSIEHRAGKSHDIYKLQYQGIWIGQFNIRRGSKRNLPHNFIADQLHLTRAQGLDFAQCMLSIDGYVDLLIAKQILTE